MKFRILLALSAIVAFQSAIAAAQEIYVARYTFCPAVDRLLRQPVQRVDGHVSIPPSGQLFFWMELRDNKKAFDDLETLGALSVTNEWRKDPLGTFVDADINVGMTPIQWSFVKERIEGEFRSIGYFTRTTFSAIHPHSGGIYQLIILDSASQSVPVLSSPSKEFRPKIQKIEG
jgi:hypothetical protein